MKTCPQCGRTYPDSEAFCDVDGVGLKSGPVRGTELMEGTVTCPVCGGKSQTGDEVCRFCGAQLASPAAAQPSRPASRKLPSRPLGSSGSFDDEPPQPQAERGGRSFLAGFGYVIAAILALVAGAWFALHVSSKQQQVKVLPPNASPMMSPAAPTTAPFVALARNVQIEVRGESAAAKNRNRDAARKVFEGNIASLNDIYHHALDSDASAHDGILVRLRIDPSGAIKESSVRTSTSPNPMLDGEVARATMGWHFDPLAGGSVEADYPIVFAHDATEQSTVEGQLADKVAQITPGEKPEYALAEPPPSAPAAPPPAPPAPALAEAPTPRAANSMVPMTEPPEEEAAAPAPPGRRRRPPEELASLPPPRSSLQQRVEDRLRTSKNMRRVHAYTDGGGTVTLSGKVFDDDAKYAAARLAKTVDGVAAVVNNLTTDTSEWAANESRISQDLQGAGLGKVTVKVIGDDAYLDGEVKNETQKQQAVSITESAARVRVRTNLIRVAPGGLFGF